MPVCCPTALPTLLRFCSAAVLLLVSTKSLRLRHPTSTVPFPQLVQQISRITIRPRCGLTLPAWCFRHILMSHASLGMQQQLLCQYCHGQCAFLTCVCFREDKKTHLLLTVASAKRSCRLGCTIVSHHSIYFQTAQWASLTSGRLPYLCLWTIPLLALVWEDGIWSGHVQEWSFAWPLPWLLSYRRFPRPNIPGIFTRHRDSSLEEFLILSLSIAALALAFYAFYHYLLPINTFS